MLLVLPLPTLISLQTSWRTKIRLYILCALGLFIIAITIIRLPINAMHAAVQANRTTWASTELLTAAIVVNAPTLYGAINRWRRRLRNETYASKSHQGDFSNARTVGSSARAKRFRRFTHSNALYDVDDDDDDELMLRTQIQTSVTSGSTTQEFQRQERIIMKTMKVSHSELRKVDAAKSNNEG